MNELETVNVCDSASVPPYPDRGVHNTNGRTIVACLDWVSVTFKNIHDEKKIVELLGLNYADFYKLERSKFGYKRGIQLGHISILFDGLPDMGVFLEMTGQGCREYESYGRKDWKQFFIECHMLTSLLNFPRLDIAIDEICFDDTRPHFSIQTLRRKIKNGECISKFWKGKFIEDLDLKEGKALGRTLYFGREKSELQFRFYEKNHERQSKGVDLPENLSAWNRSECQLRNDRAKSVVYAIINDESVGDVVRGVLNQYLSFRVRDNQDSNKSRWKVCTWWSDFLDGVGKQKLTLTPAEPTIMKKRAHFYSQYAKTAGILFLAFGNDFHMFADLISEGIDKMTERDFEMIKQFHQAQDIHKFDDTTFDEIAQKRETNKKIADLIGVTPENIIEQLRLF